MQTVLVTGASGFVGNRFVQMWRDDYRVLTPSHAEMDITDKMSVDAYFKEKTPDVVLHLAAISNTWYCEQHPRDSFIVNVQGALNVAQAAAECGAKMVFFSSDQVYNGNIECGLHGEDVTPAPETVYAKHKLQAEQSIASTSPDAVILRATWMYDSDDSSAPVHSDFVHKIIQAVAENSRLQFPVREIRGITWVKEVVKLLPYTFGLSGGVYNFGAENRLNTYETACCFFEMLAPALKCEDIILPDFDRFPEHERNISVSTEKIKRASGYNICFSDTLNGFAIFLEQ